MEKVITYVMLATKINTSMFFCARHSSSVEACKTFS
jgi:hypothetical protein